MNDKKNGNFDIVCSIFVLVGAMLFKSALIIAIISIILLLYGILKK